MGKIKIKKADIWIDMTPMSDVMTLLLCFFMLTSTFTKPEPVKVVTPSSVSEIKVPEKDVLNILVDKDGKVFMSMDNQNDLQSVFEDVTGQYSGLGITAKQEKNFLADPMFGTPVKDLAAYLSKDEMGRQEVLKTQGIPLDSIDGGMSEFQTWVKSARGVNKDIKLALKSDSKTPYKVIKRVMDELASIEENRYYLITQLKTDKED